MKEITEKLKKIADELFAVKDEITNAFQDGDEKEEILDEMWNAICGTFSAKNLIRSRKENGQD